MRTVREEALDTISKMPESVSMDDIMYRLYVIDKIRKGQQAVERGETVTLEELKKEIQSW